MIFPRKTNPREEYRQKQRERIEGSPSVAEKFPRLKALTVNLAFFDGDGVTKNGELKFKMNLQQAKSVLWFGCRGGECLGGDFDLSGELATAVAGGRRVASGEMRCQGERKKGAREPAPCQAVLRYKMSLDYDQG